MQENRDEFSINPPSNARDEFRLVLLGLNTLILAEQRQLLSCFDGLRSEARDLSGQVQSLERQAALHSVGLALGRGNMTNLKESITVTQRQLPMANLLKTR